MSDWSDHRVALALHLHIRVSLTGGQRRHYVTFSDLIVALTCLLCQPKVRHKIREELSTRESPEDFMEQYLQAPKVVARKINMMQLESSVQLLSKNNSRVVNALHPRKIRHGFGKDAAGSRADTALTWDPEIAVMRNPEP